MIVLQAPREAFDTPEMAQMGWMHMYRNFADDLSKEKPFEAMMELLTTCSPEEQALQWVLRDSSFGNASEALPKSTWKGGDVKARI